jgi:Predicted nucleoside-diphosphate-sugar epimerases
MKPKEILVFGASGQIGRHLIRKLSKNNYKVVAVTRNIHQKGYILKTQANPGYLDIVELPYFNIEKIENLLEECSICINLIGILFEKKKNFFKNIHTDFPDLLSKLSAKKNIEKLIHLSSLGIEKSINSNYAISKLEGENKIKNNFNRSVILKPSVVYSGDDNFTTNFMNLLKRLPFMPFNYEGKN